MTLAPGDIGFPCIEDAECDGGYCFSNLGGPTCQCNPGTNAGYDEGALDLNIVDAPPFCTLCNFKTDAGCEEGKTVCLMLGLRPFLPLLISVFRLASPSHLFWWEIMSL
jgi:hypothetical protein